MSTKVFNRPASRKPRVPVFITWPPLRIQMPCSVGNATARFVLISSHLQNSAPHSLVRACVCQTGNRISMVVASGDVIDATGLPLEVIHPMLMPRAQCSSKRTKNSTPRDAMTTSCACMNGICAQILPPFLTTIPSPSSRYIGSISSYKQLSAVFRREQRNRAVVRQNSAVPQRQVKFELFR